MSFLEHANQFLWGAPLLFLLAASHIFFTIYLKFPQKKTFYAIRLSVKDDNTDTKNNNLSGFAALATTLAATLGTGNIIGVSTAIALGGPGALFWCWITGIFGMATSYAECYLSVLYKQQLADGTYVGGPMYVLEYGLHKKWLGGIYALCTLFAAFGVGCTTQANSLAGAASNQWQLSPHLTGMAAALLTGFVIIGGVKSIGNFCVKIVPVLGGFYVGSCLILLWINRHYLPASISFILDSAFHTKAAFGGLIGSSIQIAARYGIARGLFTNESGIGTAAITAAASKTKDPERQALISMTAVFWDTVVMCALTGLVIISTVLKHPYSITGFSDSDYTTAAFFYFPFGRALSLNISLIAFAFTTLIGWSYLGERAAGYLFKDKGIFYYQICYIVMIYIGAVLPMELIWNFTDFINGIMVLPNVYALFALYKKIKIHHHTPPS